MKKDIEIPIAQDVFVAIVQEWDESFLSKNWNAYLINNRTTAIEMAIVVSKGYKNEIKTSTIRHGLGTVNAKSFVKVELITDDVLSLTNEFFVTFFAEGKLWEKKCVFPPNSISNQYEKLLPVLNIEGVFPVD